MNIINKINKIFKHFVLNEDHMLYEMANLKTAQTGLPMNIMLSPRQHSAGPRIKVQNNNSNNIQSKNNFITITLEADPRIIKRFGQKSISNEDFKLVVEFINKNRLVILDYWNQKIDTSEMILRITKI
jgi:hypothetical protein